MCFLGKRGHQKSDLGHFVFQIKISEINIYYILDSVGAIWEC